MNTKILFATFFCSLGLSTLSFANDKVETTYNAKHYQQICKGKTEGTEVSFPYRGIIWNGTCQTQFFPSNSKTLKGTEEQLNSSCKTDPETKTITIEGKDYKGKCALGYTSPKP